MTLNVENPVITYQGDGVKTLYTFDFSLTEESDFYARINNVLAVRYSDYDLQNVTSTGGECVFFEAPAQDDQVQLIRDTNKTQQVDYIQFDAFPAETFESGQDKIVRILQELINGTFTGIDADGNPIILSFDLGVELAEYLTTITNSGGTNADIPAWVPGETAGVYIGAYMLEASLPADGSATSLPNGYILLGY